MDCAELTAPDRAPGSDAPPRTVLQGRYQLLERIGSGSCATVYRARDARLFRDVAVKVFPAAGTGAHRPTADVERAALCKVNHRYVANLLDAGAWQCPLEGERPFLVLELVPGGDLRPLLGRPWAPVHAARLGAALAQALHAIHDAEVVHRDVKPANILLDATGMPKLCDFGVCRPHDDAEATTPGATVGTASYLSPEQALGKPVHASSDVYSLGLVLLELLTGKRVFSGPALEATMARLLADPQIPAELDLRWQALLSAMTRRDPGSRPSAQQCGTALAELAGR